MTSKVVFKELSLMIVDGALCTERKRDPLAFHWILSTDIIFYVIRLNSTYIHEKVSREREILIMHG